MDNKVSIGSWITRPDSAIAEVMAKSGYFKWLTVDIEHSPISMIHVEELIRTIQNNNVEAYVRVTENKPNLIKRVLDCGADGIIVPMVNTLEDVLKAKDAIYYPPVGKRGVGLARAQEYGQSFHDYVEKKAKEIKMIIQIEHSDAISNIDEIFSDNSIHAYFIGPYDLSASLGCAGQFDNPELLQALGIIKTAADKHNITPGFHLVPPDKDKLTEKIKEGYQMIAVSFDMLFMIDNMKRVLG